MTPRQIDLIEGSFEQLRPQVAALAELFYERLFEVAPQLRPMFPEDMAGQKEQLMAMLGLVVAGLRDLDTLLPAVRALGRRHAGYGVKPPHYAPVGSALMWTLEKILGPAFTPEIKDAWTTAYILLWTTMNTAGNDTQIAA